VRNPWQQFRAFLARRIRYKITRGGVLFTFAILLVAFGAVISANNLLFLIVAAMMATLLISGLVSRLCLAGLELDFQVPDHIPAGRSVPARLFVRNHKWFLPSFSIHVEAIREQGSPTMKSGVYFPLIAAGATLDAVVDVRFPRRGAYRQNGFAFSTAFPFGFLEKTARVTLTREMVIRRNRIAISRTRARLLSHTPLRGLREFPSRGLESVRPRRQFADPRIRPRARTDRRDLPRPRHPPRTGRVVRARRELLRLPRLAPFHPGRLDPFPL
jgi:hypothetical protein